jgi:exodeoxyribonuclease V alpha subunit
MADNESQLEERSGAITSLVYHDPAGGFTIAELTPEEGAPVTIVGVIPGAVVGENLRVRGQWETHKTYGKQLKVVSYELVRPATAKGIIAYLGGGLVKGVGPKLARSLVQHFGDKVLDILDHHPERLLEVSGIGRKRADELARAWAEHKEVHRIMVFLQDRGAGAALAGRIYEKYRGGAMAILEREPYRLAREVHGIGFFTADRLAREVGIEPNDPQRLQAGLIHALSEAAGEGHFYLPQDAMLYEAQRVLQCDEQLLDEALRAVVQSGDVHLEVDAEGQRGYFLTDALTAEKELAGLLLRLGDKLPTRVPSIEQTCEWLGKREAMGATALSPQQADAVCQGLREPVMVITGGPGTGKTTITRALADAAEALRWRVMLCSPTGRAAKRLSQLSGKPASTIHRLLSWDPGLRRFRFNEADPLPLDLLIVDECSMVDALLARDLLRAVPPGAQVIFIGDADQLPSVGPGNLLADLIASKRFPVCRLTEIYRQEAGGQIVTNAHSIREGVMPELVPGSRWHGEDCVLMERESAEEAAEAVLRVVIKSLPGLGYQRRDIQVITPMHRGPTGVIALNHSLQQALNPPRSGAAEVKRGDHIFREGDRVLQTANNYDKNVYNGDIGMITRLDNAARSLTVEFEHAPVVYEFSELDQLELAYALTVHKAQGSEYPAVVMVMHSSHYIMLRRNLLYTALTRAEKQAVIIGDRKGLWKAVRTAGEQERYTRLAARLQGELPHTPIAERLHFEE